MTEIRDIVKKMSLKEKASLLTGKGMWRTQGYEQYGIPSMFVSDGPSGMRTQEGAGDWLGINKSLPATCFPSGATVANSWDTKLAEEMAAAIGEEADAFGVNVVLGPGLNIKRNPLCGRNFEYFSEDPYLSGKMAAAYIKGIQSEGVAACPKHFAANSQELRRMANDSVMDLRTLREIYTAGFELAIREAKPKTIMSSYNQVNGVYANESHYLLRELLRDTFGFDGIVISDWGASNDHVEGVRNGSHLEMPGNSGATTKELLRAVKRGKIKEAVIDARVEELLKVLLPLCKEAAQKEKRTFDIESHHALARRAAGESIVLLKNDGGILPLKTDTKIAVIGDFAKTPRYQGAGSSLVNATKIENTLDLLETYPINFCGYQQGYVRNQPGDPELLAGAAALAKTSDAVLLYVGLDEASESEGFDRTHMRMPQSQLDLIDAVTAVNAHVIVVLSAGSVVEMPWFSKVQAVVHGYLGGQAGASAMLDVLAGKVNPSGKLNETYPMSYADVCSAPYYPSKERVSEYREGIFVGYRYYDTVDAAVRFPFGYGLSYTEFAYSNLQYADGKVRLEVENTGNAAGAEVVQIYVGKKDSQIFRASHELKGFGKIYLEKGEKKILEIPLSELAFSYFNFRTNRWECEGGTYVIEAGASARDIRLSIETTVAGSGVTNPYAGMEDALDVYFRGEIQSVPDAAFAALLGRTIPSGGWGELLERNDTFYQLSYAKSRLGRFIFRKLDRMMQESMAKGQANLDVAFFYNMPFRGLVNTTHGLVTSGMVDGFVKLMNGKTLSGLGQVIGCFFTRR